MLNHNFSFLFLIVLAAGGIAAALFFLRRKKYRQFAGRTDRAAGDRAEQSLRSQTQSAEEEKKRIGAILESMAEAVIVVDAVKRIRLANAALSRLFGVDQEGVLGRYTWEVFRDSGLNQMMDRCLKEQVVLKKEHEPLFSNKVFELQISPVFLNAELLGAVAVFHDVTALKELERMRTEFVANVSHELKTPLTSIMGFVETLKGGAVKDPSDRARFLDIIEEHSARLYRMVEDLLLLSKVESAGERLNRQTLNLRDMFDNIFAGFEASIRKGRLSVSLQADPDPFWFYAEPAAILQAFTNVTDNAIKYNKEGGRIVVRAFQRPGWSVVQIEDTGIGIPAGDLKRIFERFYRVDKSRSRGSGGTGLGLSIVKHIVERHGGTVEVKSRVEQGSTFTIQLPREAGTA